MKKELIKLISRVVGFKAIQWSGSHIFLWGVPMIFIPSDTLVLVQNKLEREFGRDEIFSLFFGLGEIQGSNGTKILLEKYNITPSEKDFSFFLEQTSMIGMGKLQLYEKNAKEQIKEGIYRLENINSPEALCYKEILGKQSRGVDFYLTGLITGACEALFNKELIGVESECIACGDTSCKFVITTLDNIKKYEDLKNLLPQKISEIEDIKKRSDLKVLLKPSILSLKDSETMLSSYLKKRYHSKIIDFENGHLSLSGITGMITPMTVIALLYNVTKRRYGKKADIIFYESGKESGAKYGIKFFEEAKLKKNEEGIRRILETVGVFGFGKCEIIRLDFKRKKIIFKVVENPLAKEYLKIFGKSKEGVDYFLAGLTAGLLETVIGKVEVSEIECLTQGRLCCLFETKD